MEFGNDIIARLRTRIGTEMPAVAAASPDWAGLHARLAAAHAARRELLRDLRGTGLAPASFDPRMAGTLGRADVVNQADSADGKDHAAKEITHVGSGMADGKGYV